MNISDRLLAGKILINQFEMLSAEFMPNDDELPKIIKRADSVKLKMLICYEKWGRPPELLEQIKQIDSVIKKLEQLHNKYVTGM